MASPVTTSQRAVAEIGKALMDRGAKPREAYDLAGLVLYERWRRTETTSTGETVDEVIDADDLAEMMGLPRSTYYRWRSRFRSLMHCDPEHLRIAEGVTDTPPGWALRDLVSTPLSDTE
jgi:hypothetical protein